VQQGPSEAGSGDPGEPPGEPAAAALPANLKDPQLREIVTRWASLPKPIRAAIGALIRSVEASEWDR
jgi:hypothetical protein